MENYKEVSKTLSEIYNKIWRSNYSNKELKRLETQLRNIITLICEKDEYWEDK